LHSLEWTKYPQVEIAADRIGDTISAYGQNPLPERKSRAISEWYANR